DLHEIVIRDHRRIEGDLHAFGMSGRAGAHLLIARVGDRAAGESGGHVLDPLQVLEDGLETPKASAGQDGRFRTMRHRSLSGRGSLGSGPRGSRFRYDEGKRDQCGGKADRRATESKHGALLSWTGWRTSLFLHIGVAEGSAGSAPRAQAGAIYSNW